MTPTTPTIAAPPPAAGFDADGVFHMGQTLLAPDDPSRSFITFRSGSGASLRIKRRRVYFFLILGVLGLVGCLATFKWILLPALGERPLSWVVLATGFALLPTVPYLLLIKALDRNDQIPWKNLLACLVWGGTVGCGFSLVLNTIGGNALAAFAPPDSVFNLTAVWVAPVVEECVKGFGILVLIWLLHDEFDNVLEGLALGAACGLGFAVVENVVYNLQFIAQDETKFWVMGSYRSMVNALIGHPVYTAMTGAGLGLFREALRSDRKRYVYPLLGLVVATGLHVLWNWASVHLSQALGEVDRALALALITAVFGGAGFLFFLAAYVFAYARERRVLQAYLTEEVERGFVTPEELASFSRLFGRQGFEWRGLLQHGWAVFLVRRALRRAQVELAFRKWHLAKGDAIRGDVVDRHVHDHRSRIRDARNQLTQLERLSGEPATEPPKKS